MLEFVIPVSREDLLTDRSDRYVPRKIVDPDELVKKLSECNSALHSDGSKFILEHFDTLVSLTIHSQKLSWDHLQKGWTIIRRTSKKMINELKEILRPNRELDESIRKPAANVTKMLVYILTQLVSGTEERVIRIGDGKVKKRGNQPFPEQVEWQEELNEIVLVFNDLLHLPLIWLWNPPLPSTEENFYNLISNMTFTILENPSITSSRMTEIKKTLLHVLGVIVVRYNYRISIVLRMIGVLNRIEHIAPTLALAVKILHDDYNCQSIVCEIIKEILESYSSEVLPQASRNHGAFFAELGELTPISVKGHLPMILPLLEQDNVSLRNGILSAMSSVVLQCLSNDDMTTSDRQQRNELLDYLLEYIYDANAFVRAKVLNLWRRLLDEGAVPQTLRCDVLEATSGRIIDSASSVRKAAIQLVTAFLEHNLASAKMGASVLQEKVDNETKKLHDMCNKYREGNPREMMWLDMQPNVENVLREYFEKEESDDPVDSEMQEVEKDSEDSENKDDDEEEDTNTLLRSVHREMCKALQNRSIIEAYKCATRIEQFAPDLILKKKESGINGKINFYMLLMGCFYSIENLSVDTIAENLLSIPLEQEEAQQLTAQQHFVDYLVDSLKFVKIMENALILLQKLLSWSVSNASSGINEGIIDAVHLVEVAHIGGVPGAKDCMKTELQLILHQPEVPVVSAIAASAKTVYFQCAGSDNMPRVERVVVSLIKFLAGLSVGEALATGELMKQWVKNGDITGSYVQVMWEIFLHPERAPEPNEEQQKQLLVLILLRMVGAVLPDRVRALVPDIATHIFSVSTNSSPNLEIAAEACAVLSSTCPAIQHNHTAPVTSIRLPVDHTLFKELSNMLKCTFWTKESNHYASFAISAVNLVYLFCLSPEIFVEDFLKFMSTTLQNRRSVSRKSVSPNSKKSGTQSEEVDQSQKDVPCFALGRFLAVVGHVAMMQMIFMDTAVYSKLRSLEEKDKVGKTKQKPQVKKGSRRTASKKSFSLNVDTCEGDTNSTTSENTSKNEEKEEGTQAEDRLSESIRQVCEIEIFKPERILGQLLPLVVKVLSKPKSYAEPDIQRTAMLSLSKMMMVSSAVCADNIQLFVTVMSNSPDTDTRVVAIIAIADITLRFPSIVEPWSKHIYGRLQDASDQVRLTTILILSRLVMCDMIKVRGQISDLALCICDENRTVANAAKKFFTELSEKHNVLYNVLPDIISGLCSSDLPEEKFNHIISFVFGLIKKEKQIEVLVEKLCQRFQLVTTEQQACDLAYCLTLLHYNNRALGRLTDHLSFYADKLHIEKVYNYFQSIIQTNSKNKAKVEMKTAADELGAAIEQVLKARSEDPDQEVPVCRSSQKTKATPRNNRMPGRGRSTPASVNKSVKKRTCRKVVWSSSDEELADIPESP